ncbi:MAG TPA: PIN domain-containing protein [Longimicrobium sp.]|nr:PIN domain-containing protein [Longimicrobium sp.]
MRRRPVALLDACVLYPFQLRNLLLHLAVEGLYRPLWSHEILAEVDRALRREARLTDEQCAHLFGQMQEAFPDAFGTGYEGAADELDLPDAGDRHVIALAAHYEADVIVTANLKHFPAVVLQPLEMEAVAPDDFCAALAASEPAAVLRAAERHRASLKSHPLGRDEYLDSLSKKAGLKRTARLLLEAGFMSRAVQTRGATR